MKPVKKLPKFGSYVMISALSFVMMYPVFWWIGASFKTNDEMSSAGFIPRHPTLSNFIDGWTAIPNSSFTHFYVNTFELIFGVLFTSIVSCSLVAFGFARLSFPLRNVWFSLVLATLMLPSQVTLVPQYTLFYAMGWVNTYLPFIVPHGLAGGIGGPFFIFLLVQFIRGIPRDLDESAKMDGSGWFGIYLRIVMPLLKPALVTVSIYIFLWNWDDYFGHLIYLNSVDKYTVDMALKMLMDSHSATPWGQLFAMSLVSVMPSVAVFIVAQRNIVEGIATTGIKG